MTPRRDPDVSSPRFKADPFGFYARLRETAPVYRIALPGKQSAWLVTRYDDVAAVLKDDRLVKDPLNISADDRAKQPWMPGFIKPLARNMLDVDGEEHARLRGLVHKAFTPRLIEQLRGRDPDAGRRSPRCRTRSRSPGPHPRLRLAPADHRHQRPASACRRPIGGSSTAGRGGSSA